METNYYTKPLREETNVLVPVRILEVRAMSIVNLCLAMFAVANVSVNVVCLVLVSIDDAASDATFHNIEFTAAFLFAVVQLLAVFFAYDRTATSVHPLVLKAVVFLNLAGTLVPLLLVYINLEKFEVPSHEIEYSASLFSALIDVLMALEIIARYHKVGDRAQLWVNILLVAVPVCVAVAMLTVYTGSGFSDGEPNGETNAHYLEFTFEMISALIVFSFCMDNKLRSDATMEVLLGTTGDALGDRAPVAEVQNGKDPGRVELHPISSKPADGRVNVQTNPTADTSYQKE